MSLIRTIRSRWEGADTIFVFSAFSVFFLLKAAMRLQTISGGYEPTAVFFWCIVFAVPAVSFSLPKKFCLFFAGFCVLLASGALSFSGPLVHFSIFDSWQVFRYAAVLFFGLGALGLLFLSPAAIREHSERIPLILLGAGAGAGAWIFLFPALHLLFLAVLSVTFALLLFRKDTLKETRFALLLPLILCMLSTLFTEKGPRFENQPVPGTLYELALLSVAQSGDTQPQLALYAEDGTPVPGDMVFAGLHTDDTPHMRTVRDGMISRGIHLDPRSTSRPGILAFLWERPEIYRTFRLFTPDYLAKLKKDVLRGNGILAASLPSDEDLAASAVASAKQTFSNVRLVRWHGLFLFASEAPLPGTLEELYAMAEKKEKESRIFTRMGTPGHILDLVLPEFEDPDRDDYLLERANFIGPVSIHTAFIPPDRKASPEWFRAFRAGTEYAGWILLLCVLCYLPVRYWRSGIPGGKVSFTVFEGGFLCGGTALFLLLRQSIGEGMPSAVAAANTIRYAALFVCACLPVFPKTCSAPPFSLRLLCAVVFLLSFGELFFCKTVFLLSVFPFLCAVRFGKNAQTGAAPFCFGVSCALFLSGLCYFSAWHMLPVLFLIVLMLKRVRGGAVSPVSAI